MPMFLWHWSPHSFPPSVTEPCPASDAEPPLNCPVLLPILRRTPDKQHANENERYEQDQEHDHNEGDVHTAVFPEAPACTHAVSCKRLRTVVAQTMSWTKTKACAAGFPSAPRSPRGAGAGTWLSRR